MLSLSIALASLIIVVSVVVLACFCFCPACRQRRASQQQQQQQQASRRSSLRGIDMPPPYPGPFIPGQVTSLDLASPLTESTAPPNNVWIGHVDDLVGADEARGGADTVEKKWPIDDDDEGHFVPDAVEMRAKLDDAIPPPPHFYYDQRRQPQHHPDHYRYGHPRHQPRGEDNNCFVPGDIIPDRSTAMRSRGVSPVSSGTPSSGAGWRRQTSAETGCSDSLTATSLNLSASSSSAAGGGFTSGSSSRRLSPPSFYIPSTGSSSISSQSHFVLSDDADTTQTDVDYY